jgi:hypothetical protein
MTMPPARLASLFLAVVSVVLSSAAASFAQSSKPKATTKSDLSDVLNELEAKAGDAWWNPEWKLRRKVVLEGPGLATVQGGLVFFRELDPLLLFNTHRCQDQFADLRIVTRNGKVMPAGVLNFGSDDGSCQIWCELTGDERTSRNPTFYIYYNNPRARAEQNMASRRLDPLEDSGIYAWLGEEETAPDTKPTAALKVGSFFAATVAVEAELFRQADGTALPPTLAVASKQASAGGLVQLSTIKGRELPFIVNGTANLATAGKWRVHVRYQNGMAKKAYEPFTLVVAGKEFICGTERRPNATFRWESFDAELPSGEAKLSLKLTGPAAPDCIILSSDLHYRPDYRDVTGPVAMRFRVLGEQDQPYYIDWYCVHTPYSAEGPQGDSACFLFRDRVAISRGNAAPLAKDPSNLAHFNQWTAWGRSLHSRAFTWFSEIRLIEGNSARPKPIRNARVAYQVATRPDPSRIYHEGVEEITQASSIRVRMPTGLDQASLAAIEGFGDWAKRRFEIARDLGFRPDEGPRKLLTTTMVHNLETPTELDNYLKTCNWLGLNTTCLHYHDDALLGKLADQYHMIGALTHPFTYKLEPPGDAQPLPGKSYAETARAIVAEKADKYYAAWGKRPKTWANQRFLYGILGDEIGPAASSLQINKEPFYKGLFVEYLKKHNLTPEFFGASGWEDVTAIDYIAESNSNVAEALNRQRIIDETERAVQQLAERDITGAGLVRPNERPSTDVLDELTKPKAAAATALDPQYEKRRCHWTQKFRSEFTCLFYRECTDAAKRYAPPGFQCSVNLQAMPAQAGQMWDGGLNIFDLARLRGFDSLYTEDWTGGTYNVSFAMGLLKAAARKHNQDTGSYVVGYQPQGRVLANLAQGARTLVFYLYGPVHLIGPVWGEHAPTMKDIGEAMRLAARAEDDLLAARNRPSDVALLVANTSEINNRYFSYEFGRERIAMYTALADAQMPVDIIGEEEILEDGALGRYRALYVGDLHVDSRAQQKIKDWVADGGTLWASYAALGRQEYDEPSTAMDEVFGLKSRGPLEPQPSIRAKPQPPAAKVTVIQNELLPAFEFDGSYCQPKYELSTGKALGQFADGSPAIVHNRFGQGQAFLNAFQARIFVNHAPQLIPLVLTAARAAGARQHVRASVPELFTMVHDGPKQTVVYLYNDSQTETKTLPLEVVLPKLAAKATSSRSGPLPITARSDAAVVNISLPPRTGDIVVFGF